MILNDPFFIGICFFTIGFLSLVGFTSAYLNYLFKSKTYRYYSLYIVTLLLFIVAVYAKDTGDFPLKSDRRNVMQLVVDGLQMLSALLFCAFIYHAMVSQDVKYKKLKKAYYSFIAFTGFYFIIMLLFPDFVRVSFSFFVLTRVIIYLISILFYYHMAKGLKIVFFRYLFLATTFLFVSGILALWDSTVNAKTSIYTGFHYLCYGYFFENICFIGAFIYKYFIVDKEKREVEHQHKMQLFTTKFEIQQQTMEYIGKEIHDNIGQKLTLASLYTQQLEYKNTEPDSKESIDNVSLLINESLAEMRELTKSLIDNAIEKNSIYKLIKEECERVKKLKLFTVKLSCNIKDIDLDYQSKTILVRILQEFFQNSIKHSECKNLTLQLNVSDKNVVLMLVDDGKGFDISKTYTNGIGLNNMKKRTEMLEGQFTLESQLSIGTKVTVTLPLK
ncbi:sensor histidine kinase [Flavobacterium phycosphaerae]|uniref:sensor histidine kinase n=1 Tax=Flavobacterium phycosphaerae TaxID=2697515 RepID=UPI00138A2BDD|nr:sensor histidine kinase [Flavobacterium phycosphaerae]